MKDSEIIELLSKVFFTVFGKGRFGEDYSINNTTEWDSLKHIGLIMEIETAFNIQIQHVDIIEMISVPKIISIIKMYKELK